MAAHCKTAQQPVSMGDQAPTASSPQDHNQHTNPSHITASKLPDNPAPSKRTLVHVNLQNCLAMKPQRHTMNHGSILCTDSTLHAQSPMERCLALHCILLHSTHSTMACCRANERTITLKPELSWTPNQAARRTHTPGCLQCCGSEASPPRMAWRRYTTPRCCCSSTQRSHTCNPA
jgi:hypothetical protein